MKILENKGAIITGAGSRIGLSIALLYSNEGAKIVLTDIDEKDGNSKLNDIKFKGGEGIFVKADSSKTDDNERVVQEAILFHHHGNAKTICLSSDSH